MVLSRHEPMQCDDERRDGFLRLGILNGVDYVEYRRDDLHTGTAPPHQSISDACFGQYRPLHRVRRCAVVGIKDAQLRLWPANRSGWSRCRP